MALTTGMLSPRDVFGQQLWGSDWNGKVYSAKSIEAFVMAMRGEGFFLNSSRVDIEKVKIKDLEIASDGDITIEAPELAENGTNVPVKLSTKIPQANFIALMADHNPNPVCVGFHVLPNTEPTYSVRVKVAETSSLLAVVRSNNKWFYSSKDIVVMIGGCLA
tara:strand:- start:488 stop:973 length:486 start_codon:yes stop_codon:yes gene_type:complete